MGYTLRPGLSFCVCQNQVICLDIDSDSYFALPDGLSGPFLNQEAQSAADSKTIAALVERRILIPTSHPGLAIAACRASVPEHSALDTFVPPAGLAVTPEALLHLWRACRAHGRLPLQAQLRMLERHRTTPAPIASIDLARLASFLTVRRLWSVRDRCLPFSIACVTFLAAHGYSATLVLGVRTEPFEAHAWAQAGSSVLNDDLGRVRLFTPILAV